jgi:hypothetical protein
MPDIVAVSLANVVVPVGIAQDAVVSEHQQRRVQTRAPPTYRIRRQFRIVIHARTAPANERSIFGVQTARVQQPQKGFGAKPGLLFSVPFPFAAL